MEVLTVRARIVGLEDSQAAMYSGRPIGVSERFGGWNEVAAVSGEVEARLSSDEAGLSGIEAGSDDVEAEFGGGEAES